MTKSEVLAVLEALEVLEVLAATDEDIRPPAGRDKRDPPAGLRFPFPKLIVVGTSGAIGYNIGVRRMCHSAMDCCVERLETTGGPLSSAASAKLKLRRLLP